MAASTTGERYEKLSAGVSKTANEHGGSCAEEGRRNRTKVMEIIRTNNQIKIVKAAAITFLFR